ncbi:MAG TPA: response regulator [Tepidisphaeraceae bacterium]|nr:response regulator [Tepidisphaeraceae bacterium]
MAPVQTPPALPPRVLVVDDEPALREVIEDVVRDGMSCRVLSASNIAQARRILATQSVQLLVTDIHLPDGDGTSLLTTLQRHQPSASAIVITGAPTMDVAIAAMREGAVDFVPKPFTHNQLVERLQRALDRQARLDKQEKRFDRLKVAVKRLNEARRTIGQKVDLLCNDLVSAYGELSRQLDGVRTQEGFRKFIEGAKDLEQLLCHAMDWLLRQVGYCNVAVYLAGEDSEFQLGAYMKYTLAGDQILTDAVKRVLLPLAVRDGVSHALANEQASQFTPQELALLKGQDVLAVNCTYLGESLAGLLFFRDSRTPFTADDEALVKAISPIFAVALASVVRDTNTDAGDAGDAGDAPDEDGPSAGADDEDEGNVKDKKPKSRRRPDPADWWKNGGKSPF